MIRRSEAEDARPDSSDDEAAGRQPDRAEQEQATGGGASVEPPDDVGRESKPRAEEANEAAAEGEAGLDQAIADAFEAEVAEVSRRADENWDRYLRAEAELENTRKRAEKRREEALKLQRRDLVSGFLEVMDNLERALLHGEDDPNALLDGVETTYRELARSLAREGVEQIAAMDEPFDPELHEAVGVVPLPSGEDEKIVAVDRPGYTIDGRLLRPARVLVGKPAEPEQPDGT